MEKTVELISKLVKWEEEAFKEAGVDMLIMLASETVRLYRFYGTSGSKEDFISWMTLLWDTAEAAHIKNMN